jgi:4-amino-4-deoxy-L-arabinose transferase-like glycosyltransferase
MTLQDLIKKHWSRLALLVITLSGFLLRMNQLTWQCLNVDEATTSMIANNSVSTIIHYSLTTDYNPPLYYLIAHYSFIIFNEVSRFSVRFPAVIFGTLAIPVAYMVAREIKGVTLGLLVAGLVSFMFPFYYYSQDARAYSLVLLAFMGFSYFFVRIYKGNRDRKMIWGLSACAALCLWSHYYSLVPITLMGLILLRKDWLSAAYAASATMLLMSPLAFLFDLTQLKTRTMHVGAEDYFWATPQQMATWLPNELLCWSWIILIPLFAYSLGKYWRDTLIRDLAVVAAITAAALIPLTILTGISPRYALLISPLILMVAMYPVAASIDDNKRSNAQKITIFMLVMFLIFLFNYGSIVEWTSFNVCPFMTETGAAAPG